MDEQGVVDSIIRIVLAGTYFNEWHRYEAAKRLLFNAQCGRRYPGDPEAYDAAIRQFCEAFGI